MNTMVYDDMAAMPHPLLTTIRPLFVAHRGVSALAPANTLEAFRLAPEYGFDGIETDVHLTANHVPVLHHDPTIVLDGAPVAIADIPYERLHRNAPHIPTLTEAFTSVPDHLLWQLELKSRHPSSIQAMAPIIREHLDRVYFTSFNIAQLDNAALFFPDSPHILLIEKINKRTLSLEEYLETIAVPHRCSGVSVHALEITPEVAHRCRVHNLLLGAWGIKDDPERFQRALQFPLSFMTLDAPLFSR